MLTETDDNYDVKVNVYGGGITGQAEAIRLAISRAMCEIDNENRTVLKPEGLLTRDPRMVERKKFGQKKAHTMREHIAVKEAQKLNIPIFAMVDTNSDPRDVDYLIPSNDDASKSIDIIMTQVTNAVAEGLAERKSEKAEGDTKKEKAPKKEKKSENAPQPTPETVETKAPPVLKKATEVEVDVKATKKAVEEDAKEAQKKVAKTKKSDSDDLTKIEGVGPKAAEALVKAGMESFAKLAKGDAEKIKEVLTEASSRMAHLDPASWPKQAQMAADGKWDELKEWQDSVKGGVE
ncbi:UNVERIFIED_CONTAM: hypothetical protein GTU68_041670 [Idotea baltica]|nr:hypothetical protein [Idotea baltica]